MTFKWVILKECLLNKTMDFQVYFNPFFGTGRQFLRTKARIIDIDFLLKFGLKTGGGSESQTQFRSYPNSAKKLKFKSKSDYLVMQNSHRLTEYPTLFLFTQIWLLDPVYTQKQKISACDLAFRYFTKECLSIYSIQIKTFYADP